MAMIPTPAPTLAPLAEGSGATWDSHIAAVFQKTCGACHASPGQSGLVMATYEGLMAGGKDGKVITPGDPDSSAVVQLISAGHFAKFNDDDMQLVTDWIAAGAPEN